MKKNYLESIGLQSDSYLSVFTFYFEKYPNMRFLNYIYMK